MVKIICVTSKTIPKEGTFVVQINNCIMAFTAMQITVFYSYIANYSFCASIKNIWYDLWNICLKNIVIPTCGERYCFILA